MWASFNHSLSYFDHCYHWKLGLTLGFCKTLEATEWFKQHFTSHHSVFWCMALQFCRLLRQFPGCPTCHGESEHPSTQTGTDLVPVMYPGNFLSSGCPKMTSVLTLFLSWYLSLFFFFKECPTCHSSSVPHHSGDSQIKVPEDMSSGENLPPGCRNLYSVSLYSKDQETRRRDHKVKSIFLSGRYSHWCW